MLPAWIRAQTCVDRFVDARLDAEGQAIPGRIDRCEQRRQLVLGDSAARAAPARTLLASAAPMQSISMSVGGKNVPWQQRAGSGSWNTAAPAARIGATCASSASARFGVDHRADVGVEAARVADDQFRHRALEHVRACARRCRPAGTERAAPSSVGRRSRRPRQHVGDHLLGQRRAESTIIAFWPPVSAISDRLVIASARATSVDQRARPRSNR